MSTEIPLSELKVSINLDQKPKSGAYIESRRISKHILTKSWSPIVFKGGERLQKNFLFSDWGVLDYENGTTLEEAQNNFCDCVHIIGTTKSHTEESHRFRVLIPWMERITDLETFRYNQASFINKYDTDQACKDGARFYFPCTKIVSVNTEGFRLDVKAPPPKPKEEQTYKHVKTGFSSVVTFFMKNPIHEGKRNHHVYKVAKDLYRIGLDKRTVKTIILKSPTYRDSNPANFLGEITQTMESAWRSIYA